jgi:hypothetical protein
MLSTNPSSLSDLELDYLQLKLRIEREKRRRLQQRAAAAPADWQTWLKTLFPQTFTAPFAARHVVLWQWLESIETNAKPTPAAFVDVEPRGGGKTTAAETAVIRLGAREARRFVLYVRSTQEKANESIGSIASKIESQNVERHYPLLSQRSLGKYGQSKGWTMSLLRCANAFNVLALGLDVAVRGVKLGDYRPDLIIFDDVDDEHDSPAVIKKKVDTITKSIIPAGAVHCAYLVVQNMIHVRSIVTSLVEDTADFLHDRLVSGPHPAVENLAYEARPHPERGYRIVGGEATWAGQDLATCEQQINEWGLSSFLREAQHEVEESGGIWDHIEFRHIEFRQLPDLVDGEVWVDPAVTSTDESDCQAIVAGGISDDGDIYALYGWENISSPLETLKRALLKAIEYGFRYVGVETDQGGDTWVSVYQLAWQAIVDGDEYPHVVNRETAAALGVPVDHHPHVETFINRNDEWQPYERPSLLTAKAGAGHGSKVERNQRMLTDYERGQVIHVIGTHTAVERSLRRFPQKPLDLADAAYWLWYHLQRKRRKFEVF